VLYCTFLTVTQMVTHREVFLTPLFFIHYSRNVHILHYYTTWITFGNLTIIMLTVFQYIWNSYIFQTQLSSSISTEFYTSAHMHTSLLTHQALNIFCSQNGT